MGFGSFIRSKRTEAGIALNDFARMLDISPAYWSRIEREMEKAPKDELVAKSAQLLNLDPDTVFIEAERFPPDIRSDVKLAVSLYRRYKPIGGR